MTTDLAEPILTELAALKTYLDTVREALAGGAMPNLAGLDQRIAAVCTQMQQADKPVQQRCVPVLTALVKDLDACEQDMRAAHERRIGKGVT